MSFYKLIYNLGQNLRNPSINKQLLFLKDSETWSLEKLEAYQLEKLQELIQFAYKHSSFYRNKWDDIAFTPNDIQSLEDINKIPLLTKGDLIEKQNEIQATYIFKKVIKAITSGSTGQSFEFYRDEYADSFSRASIFRGYSWYGVKPWDRNGYFWGFNYTRLKKIKTMILDGFQNRFRVFSYSGNEFEYFVKKLQKTTYLHGYSSMIYQSAKLINENNLPKPTGLKLVKGTSEKIFDKYQEEVQKAFGLKIISEYGATESGIIAFECPEGNMHLNMEGVIVEEIDSEIVVTNLHMKSFPIIRYKLGDYISLAPREKKCACGRAHLILEEVTGRIGNNIYGKEHIYPSLYFYYIFKNLVKTYDIVLNYQVIQEKKGVLKFKLEQSINENELKLLKEEIHKYFKDDIEYHIEQSTTIISTDGKLKNFISNIDG